MTLMRAMLTFSARSSPPYLRLTLNSGKVSATGDSPKDSALVTEH